MKMNKSMSKSTSDNLIDLYTRIPDYSEVQHLGQSDFINTLERLKEEFRQCRASLYNEEFCSDSEYLAGKSSPTDGKSKISDNLYYYSTSSKFATTENKSLFGGLGYSFEDGHGKAAKINNQNVAINTTSTALNDNSGIGGAGERSYEDRVAAGSTTRGGQYLSIKSCELHRTPYRTTSTTSLVQSNRYLGNEGTRSFLLGDRGDCFDVGGKNTSNYYDDSEDNDDNEVDDLEGYENRRGILGRNDREWSIDSSNSDISISKWSSSPEIYRSRSRSKEYLPPSNIEQRMLQRKSRNNSAPSVAFKDQPEETPKPTFKANPVPHHIYKPLYEFIMLKNQRRSERIREQSKKRLLSQMKPFSFCKDQTGQQSGKTNVNRSFESLNNTKVLKKKRNDTLGNIKTNNNRLNCTSALFKAKPAPPRTKALLAAIRQKEQQDYRELKKRLRAETLLKNASLPPSMAAREKRTKITNAKIDEVLQDYHKSFTENKRKGRNYREMSTATDDTGLLTDEDRMTEDDFGSGVTATTKKITTSVRPFKFSLRSPRKFTSFGTSRHSAAASGVFESSSNDNHASRLRYQAAKEKEHIRIKREEDEMLKIIRAERRRVKLRNGHLHAWQHACSYSAEQDIAMRRQLRHAASILERETFIRDMSSMLSRVRSAPLLLEGGDRLERKQEPCKKHRDEFQKLFPNTSTSGGGGSDRPWNKLSTPRLYTWSAGSKQNAGSNRAMSMLDRYGCGGADDKSETAALAEGSLSDSDNESSGDDDDGDGHHNQITYSPAATDSGSSDLEEDGNEEVQHANVLHSSKTVGATDGSIQQGEVMTGNRGNQDNGENTENKEGRDGQALVTDNEIDDEAEDESVEKREEASTQNANTIERDVTSRRSSSDKNNSN